MSRQYVVYDERAEDGQNTDDAWVLVMEDTERQAMRWDGYGYVYRYDVEDGNQLVNETFIGPTKVLARRLERERR